MKKGKTCKLNGFTRLKSTYGTVDSRTFKSLYLNIQSWVTPKKNVENWSRVINILNRELKETIGDFLDLNLFQSTFICDLDLRTSGLVMGKKSFMNLEITFFVNKNVEFKSLTLKKHLQDITSFINSHNFSQNIYFDFEKTKKTKTIETT
jgi:hypothetical protein